MGLDQIERDHLRASTDIAATNRDGASADYTYVEREIERIDIDGVGVDCVDMPTVVRAVDATIAAHRQCTILAVNPEKISAAARDTNLRAILNASEWLIPDGIGAVVAARLRGADAIERVPGSELMPHLCALAARRRHRVFLFGARADVNRAAVERLSAIHPELVIAGRHHGFVADADMPALVERINAAAPHIVFVALGSPRQEQWIARHRARLTANVIQGVGGTFDVIAGAAKRAPPIWIKLNLEWLYRFAADPRRWRRQLTLARFGGRLLRDALTRRRQKVVVPRPAAREPHRQDSQIQERLAPTP